MKHYLIITQGILLIAIAIGLSGCRAGGLLPPAEVTVQPPLPTPTPPAGQTEAPGISLVGRIIDQATDQPVAGATVRVGAQTTATGSDGGYTLTGLLETQVVLSVTRPGYDPALSAILTLDQAQPTTADLSLYPSETTPYPADPMRTNPLDPNGAPTPAEAERLARLQGLTGQVAEVRETRLTGEYLVNYRIGDEVRAAVAEIDHDAWVLTDARGQTWWIIKVCGNLAQPVPTEVSIPTPKPRPLPPLAEVAVPQLSLRSCASGGCGEVGLVSAGSRVEVLGCLPDGVWCQVSTPAGLQGWCGHGALRMLAVASAVPQIAPSVPQTPASAANLVFTSDHNGSDDIYRLNVESSAVTRLTSHPAQEWQPALSPDGKQVAYVALRQGGGIFLMDIDGGNKRYLTGQWGEDWEPAWSPDGKRIAFESTRRGIVNNDIYLINVDGSGLTYLAQGRHPSWSPSGDQIAFSRDGIYLMQADGSNQRRILQDPTVGFVTWSPDGQRLVFNASKGGGRVNVYVINVDGSGLTQVTDFSGANTRPVWSPDGQYIIFNSKLEGDVTQFLYQINADGSSLTRLTEGYYPDWSFRLQPGGELGSSPGPGEIIYQGEGSLWLIKADGSDNRQVITRKGAEHPAWSADGQLVSFTTTHRDIIIFNLDTGAEVANITLPSDIEYPAPLSPDGGQLALSYDQTGELYSSTQDICLINIDGSNLRCLTQTGRATCPSWSPNGSQLIFSQTDGQGATNIYTINTDGSGLRQLTYGGKHTCPAWSPDGQLIAYYSRPNQRDITVYVMQADGSQPRALAFNQGIDLGAPSWSPDGSALTVFGGDPRNIYRVPVDGSPATILPSNVVGAGPAWRPGR